MHSPLLTNRRSISLAAAIFGAALLLGQATPAHAKRSLEPLTYETRDTGDSGGGGSSSDDSRETDEAPECREVSKGGSSGDFERSFNCDRVIGNDTFGAGYELSGSVTADANSGNHKRRYEGRMWVGGKVFGYDLTLFESDAFVSVTNNDGYYGELTVRLQGQVLHNQSVSSNFGQSEPFQRTMLEQTAPFYVGPFTISVTAGLAVDVEARLDGSVGRDIYATMTPRSELTAYGAIKVALPLNVVSAEVTAELDLLTLRTPVEGVIDQSGGTGTYLWKLYGHMTVGSLSGWVKVTAKALFGLITFYKATIAEWDGYSATYEPYNDTGTLSF